MKREDHMTPFGTTQNFVFASFSKVSKSWNTLMYLLW
jgi:hypothetical protein